MKSNHYSSQRHRGVVLLAMLVFVFMLTFIVIMFIEEVEGRIRYRAQTSGDHELRRIAYDYLEHSFAVLNEFQTFDSALNARSQGWGDPLSYAPFPIEYPGVEVAVSIEDATTDLPMASIDEESFLLLFEALGISRYDSYRLRDGYFDWVDADDDARIQGAEKRDYEVNRQSFILPPNADIYDEDEFDYILGFSEMYDPDSRFYNPAIIDAFKKNITLESTYPVNLNVASESQLEYFRLKNALRPDTIRQFLAGRDRILGTEDDQFLSDDLPRLVEAALGDGKGEGFGFEMKLCRIQIDLVRWGSVGFHVEALIDLGGSGGVATNDDSAENESEETDENDPDQIANVEAESSSKPKNKSDKFEILVIRENFVDSES